MKEEVFMPLGLNENTFVYREDVTGGTLSLGHKPSFLKSRPYTTPSGMYEGNKPAGHIISSAEGLMTWLKIHMGLTHVSDFWSTLIEKAHEPDKSVEPVDGFYHAAGWMVSKDRTQIMHEGEIPNFVANMSFWPDKGTAVCVLMNSTAGDPVSTTDGIFTLLNGGVPSVPDSTLYVLLDTIAVWAGIVLAIIVCVLMFFILKEIFGIIQGSAKEGFPKTRGCIVIAATFAALAIAVTVLFPSLFGLNWGGGLFNAFVSPAVLMALVILCGAGILLFVHAAGSSVFRKKTRK
jgi:hypothetical protein